MCIWINDFSGTLVPMRRPAPHVDCPRCGGSGIVFARTRPMLTYTMPSDCPAAARGAWLEDEHERDLFGLPSRPFLVWWLDERRRMREWAILVDAARRIDYEDARYEQQTAQAL